MVSLSSVVEILFLVVGIVGLYIGRRGLIPPQSGELASSFPSKDLKHREEHEYTDAYEAPYMTKNKQNQQISSRLDKSCMNSLVTFPQVQRPMPRACESIYVLLVWFDGTRYRVLD